MRKSLFFYICLTFSLFLVTSVWSWPIPDSGQDKCRDLYGNQLPSCPSPGEPLHGQDASYSINPRSYIKLDDQGNALPNSATKWAMVLDNVTGLIWEAKTNGGIHDKDDEYYWQDAQDEFIAELNKQNFGGHNDWRLPTFKELASLADLGATYPPTIDTDYFPKTASSRYWSSTPCAYDGNFVWCVSFNHGGDSTDEVQPDHYLNWHNNYVRAVRSGQSGSFDDLIINSGGTVTDPNSGLTWQRATAKNQMTWSEALNYCENLNLGGHSDWRLPAREELRSIMDYNTYTPVIDEQVFPDTASAPYWSSTIDASDDQYYAWHVNLSNGLDDTYPKSSSYYVRAVRSGQGAPYTGEIVGILKDYTNLQPIENGSVSCSGGQASTSSSGQYKIENLTPGNYTLTASAPLYHSKNVENVEVQSGKQTIQDIELEKKAIGALVGKVLNVKDLSPVENVQVDLQNTQNQYQDFTSTQGEFSFDNVKTGDYTLDIYDPDYWGISKNASIYIDEVTNATLTVIPQDIVDNIQAKYIYDEPLNINSGWNLVGALNAESTNVTSIISEIDQTVISVWKWADSNWSVFLPEEDDNGTSYAESKGFGILETIEPGEGFWVNCQ